MSALGISTCVLAQRFEQNTGSQTNSVDAQPFPATTIYPSRQGSVRVAFREEANREDKFQQQRQVGKKPVSRGSTEAFNLREARKQFYDEKIRCRRPTTRSHTILDTISKTSSVTTNTAKKPGINLVLCEAVTDIPMLWESIVK